MRALGLRDFARVRGDEPLDPFALAHYAKLMVISFDEIKDNKIANSIDPSKPGSAVEGPKMVDGKFDKAAELSGDNGFTFPGIGHFTRAALSVGRFRQGKWRYIAVDIEPAGAPKVAEEATTL